MKKKYEIMVIFSNELNEADVEKSIESSITKKLKEVGGHITFEDYWGPKGFAYLINKQKWGYYWVAQFELDPQKISELRKEWNIDKEILRFIISHIDEKSKPPKKFAELKAEYEALEKKNEKEKPEPAREIPSREKLTTVEKKKMIALKKEKETLKQTPPPTAEKKEAESVDKKLDDIIKDSALDL